MKPPITTFCLLIFVFLSYSQELVISGSQESTIAYTIEQNIEVPPDIKQIRVSFVKPQNFNSQTYTQEILGIDFKMIPDPIKQEKMSDKYGNLIYHFHWENLSQSVTFKARIKAHNSVQLAEINSTASYPLPRTSPEFFPFLEGTDLVQSNNPHLIHKARELAEGSEMQIEVVRAVLQYIVDHLHYDLVPERFDALYAFEAGRGNCQNYSHLAAALLRALSIPVRIVNGLTFKKNYTVPVDQSEYSFDMAEGRHAWIEVYFPDLGWLPFDAQQTEFFVSNRYLRIEIGRDNEDTIQDGLIKWTRRGEATGALPRLQEAIASDFLEDKFAFIVQEKIPSIRRLLLTPPLEGRKLAYLESDTAPLIVSPPEEIKKDTIVAEDRDYRTLVYNKPHKQGNLNFPRQFDFLSAHFVDQKSGEIKKQFMVETAEYVTGGEQYAQMFVLDEPILLKNISTALHLFGGEGLIWINLSEDIDGQPGVESFSSKKNMTGRLPGSKGYDWISFDFSGEGLILSPGKYWISLNYSGSPIVNWFYIYGKPVGPVEGTRSREVGHQNWGKILNFEFNYRVMGLAAK
jgi:hypothetical protein